MIVIKTSLFPASKDEVFNKLQKLKLLQYIAWPYATFTPVGEAISVWKEGTSSSYRFKLFGIIPFGTHKINVIDFDKELLIKRGTFDERTFQISYQYNYHGVIGVLKEWLNAGCPEKPKEFGDIIYGIVEKQYS